MVGHLLRGHTANRPSVAAATRSASLAAPPVGAWCPAWRQHGPEPVGPFGKRRRRWRSRVIHARRRRRRLRGVGILWRHRSRRQSHGPGCFLLLGAVFIDVEARGVILRTNIEARGIVLRTDAK